MGLLVLASAAGFACLNPTHHDGDAIRCAGDDRSMRLHAIDAPEMPGACRPGRRCTPGDPFAARDYLAGLTRGRQVICEQVDTDNYGRRVVDCTADGINLGCAMVAGGQAIERYGRLNCATAMAAAPAPPTRPDPVPPPRPDPAPPPRPDPAPATAAERHYAPAEALGIAAPARSWPLAGIAVWLGLANAAAYAAMAVDKRRARAGNRRLPETLLLGLAAIGGSAGALIAQRRFRHKTRKQPFASLLFGIAGVQAGGLAGRLLLAF